MMGMAGMTDDGDGGNDGMGMIGMTGMAKAPPGMAPGLERRQMVAQAAAPLSQKGGWGDSPPRRNHQPPCLPGGGR